MTATQISTSEALLVDANTAVGVMAKLISPQSITIAAAAVKLVGQNFATILSSSLGLLAYVCLCTLLPSIVL